MSSEIYTLTCPRDDRVFIHIMHGHFITANNHINYYVGTSDIKHNQSVSVHAARLLSEYYKMNDILVDTVLCLYETQSLGAFLARELAKPDMYSPNPNKNIFIIGSEYDAAGNLIFRDNLRKMILKKNVVILISSITSGRTVEKAMESVDYYGGKAVGVSSIFSVVDKINGLHVNTIFDKSVLPDYQSFEPHNCPYCKAGIPIDAISNGYGYSKI